jgi:hypothetical protein
MTRLRSIVDWLLTVTGTERHLNRDIIVVRHDLSPAYYFFLRAFASSNQLRVVVDRRRVDRRRRDGRIVGDRRMVNRRGPVPQTWELADFVLVPRLNAQ